jgi:hypothetical protein
MLLRQTEEYIESPLLMEQLRKKRFRTPNECWSRLQGKKDQQPRLFKKKQGFLLKM